MMITDETTPIVISIVQELISVVREIDPKWKNAYLRFFLEEGHSQAKASYVHESGVELISVFQHGDFYESTVKKGEELFASLGKKQGLFLLIADSNLSYEIKFEYDDMSRWQINKLDGNTGVPVGIE
jgi:hypothetical protein